MVLGMTAKPKLEKTAGVLIVGCALALGMSQPALTAPANNLATRQLGVNMGGPTDNVRWPLFANVAKTGRYGQPGRGWARDESLLDSDGNPIHDFSLFFFDQGYGTLYKVGGKYTIKFNGKAVLNDGGVSTNYDSDTNTTTATLTLPNNYQYNYELKFTSTQRTASSDTNTGITNLRVMRPLTPGDTDNSYPDGTVFTNEIKNTVSTHFHVIRGMDFGSVTNGNDWEDSWTERVRPIQPQTLQIYANGSNRHRGGSWEYMVQFANETGTDLYLNVPVAANNEYITKLAQLLRYGSDGVEPYTSTQTTPKFAPLNSSRKVYVELSNEIWNSANPYIYQQNWAKNQATNSPSNDPIRYDGTTDSTILRMRWQAKRTVEVSELFRQVWGNDNMGSRVRPVLMWQQGNAGWPNTAGAMLTFLHNWYNNGNGNTNVSTPRPVNYYIWGGGGSFYNGPSSANSVDDIFSTWDTAAWARDNIKVDVAWAKAFGLAAVHYEGGPSFGDDNYGQTYVDAWNDARMKTKTIDGLKAAEANGTDLAMFFHAGGVKPGSGTGSTFEVITNVYDPVNTSPKMQGIDVLNDTTTKETVTAGVTTGTSGFKAAEYEGSSHDRTASSVTVDADSSGNWGYGGKSLIYLVRASSSGAHNLRVNYTASSSSRLRVVANGVVAGILNLPARSTAGDSVTISIDLGSGLNGVRLQNLDSQIKIYNIFIVSSSAPPSVNLVSNPSFDAENFNTQTPSGWSEWSGQGGVKAGYTEGGGASGARRYTQWLGSSYNMYTYQTKTGLTNGLYTLRAKAMRGGNQSTCFLEAKDFGAAAKTASIPTASSYQTVEIQDINVSNGQCIIGVWTVSSGGSKNGSWVYFDDVEFFKQ